LPLKGDIVLRLGDVSYGPQADIVAFEAAGLPTWVQEPETDAPITDMPRFGRSAADALRNLGGAAAIETL
jgi:hypothetical protein